MNLEKGMLVTVRNKTFGGVDFLEGNVELVEKMDNGNGNGIERWRVCFGFPDQDEIVERNVHAQDIVQ